MSIFRRKTAPEPQTKEAGLATMNPVLVDAIQLWDGSMHSYGTVYRKLPPVRTVVDFIAGAVSTTPWKVYRREENGRPEQRAHPLSVLLHAPNPNLSEKQLKFRTTADRAIYGNAYWRKVREGGSRFLVPLPPYRVTPREGDLTRAAWYDFWGPSGQAPIRIPADEIVHFQTYDPEDPRIGASKLEALKAVLLEEVGASRYRKSFWSNNASLEIALSTPGTLSEDAYNRLLTRFENRHAGPDNAGKTALFEEDLKPIKIGSSSRDAEFIAGRLFVLEATARVFNVPLPVLSLTAQATYASQQEFRKAIYQDLLPEWYEDIQGGIELQLLPDFSDTDEIYVEFAIEAKLRGDFLDQASVLNLAVGRPYMTASEARSLQNLPDRGEDTDDELAVPVGPNLALEGMATAPVAPIAPVTPLPRAASVLWAFYNRQERAVLPRIGAKSEKAFDRDRWDRELAEIVGEDEAQRINLETELQLADADDPREVFERRRAALGG